MFTLLRTPYSIAAVSGSRYLSDEVQPAPSVATGTVRLNPARTPLAMFAPRIQDLCSPDARGDSAQR